MLFLRIYPRKSCSQRTQGLLRKELRWMKLMLLWEDMKRPLDLTLVGSLGSFQMNLSLKLLLPAAWY